MGLVFLLFLAFIVWVIFQLMKQSPPGPKNKNNKIKKRFMKAYPEMPESFADYLQTVYDRCVQEYHTIVSANPKIDAGHSVNHVKKVEKLAFVALQQYYVMNQESDPALTTYVTQYYRGDQSCLELPKNAVLRVMIASLLHEVGDSKFKDGKVEKSKVEIIGEVVKRVLHDYPKYSEELKTNIINMIDYCGAATWGDRIPEGSKLYELIIRWADRLEATGYIGLARTLTFSYSKRATGYPVCRDEDEFPTSLEELERMAPNSRWLAYSSYNKKSESGFSHYLDKIVHICGQDVPIPFLADLLNQGQLVVKQFVVDFTIKNDKKFDFDWLISHLDAEMYNVEIKQLREMQQFMRDEGSKWVM